MCIKVLGILPTFSANSVSRRPTATYGQAPYCRNKNLGDD